MDQSEHKAAQLEYEHVSQSYYFFLTPAEIIYEINRWLKVERFYIEKEASRGMKTPIRIAEVSYSIDSNNFDVFNTSNETMLEHL